jgi:hypothetical protein
VGFYLEGAQYIEVVRRGMPIYTEQAQVGGLRVVVGLYYPDIFDNQLVLSYPRLEILRVDVKNLDTRRERMEVRVMEGGRVQEGH